MSETTKPAHYVLPVEPMECQRARCTWRRSLVLLDDRAALTAKRPGASRDAPRVTSLSRGWAEEAGGVSAMTLPRVGIPIQARRRGWLAGPDRRGGEG